VVRDPAWNLLPFTEKNLAASKRCCPAELWDDPRDQNRFWHIAYHTLFFLHLYLHESMAVIQAWEVRRKDYGQIEPFPWDPVKRPEVSEFYSQAKILAFWEVSSPFLNIPVPVMTLTGSSGFDWLPFDKLGLQFYSLRHFQQHVEELMESQSSRAGISVDWKVLH
jgi:hypothetical protein